MEYYIYHDKGYQQKMIDQQDFDDSSFEESKIITKPQTLLINVKKFISQPNPLMQKIQFSSYTPVSHFPSYLAKLPSILTAPAQLTDANNMNLIQESTFRHQKLKRDVLKVLTARQSQPTLSLTLPTLQEYYGHKQPIYERYSLQNLQNDKINHFSTYMVDFSSVKKKNEMVSIQPRVLKKQSGQKTYQSKVNFDSNFQSGNLFRVYQTQYNEYDLILQNDINTKGNNQWFFFSVKNVPKGANLTFNIVNLIKDRSLFEEGMKPTIFSTMRYEKRKVGWVREGLRINYQQNKHSKRQNGNPYFVLSFSYKFIYDGDTVYFSHSYPYTLTDLSNYLGSRLSLRQNQKIIKLKQVCETLWGNQIDLLEISDENEVRNSQKKIVWIMGRQHPGEVTSSFMVQGIIDFLLSEDEIAQYLVKNYVFKIVPMVNVDGVVHGNTRAEMTGTDPNRRWHCPDKKYNSAIYTLKKWIEKDKDQVEMVIDLHSHSRKFGTFFYGNQFSKNRNAPKILPYMVSKNDSRFVFSECRFGEGNDQTARKVLYEKLQIPNVYTIQSSFYGYQRDDHTICPYFPNDYRQMGKSFICTFAEYTNKINNCFIEQMGKQSDQEIEIQKINPELQDQVQKKSVGSDSDPGEDEFDQKELRKLLPKTFNIKKKVKKTIKTRRQSQVTKIEKMVQVVKKIQKQPIQKRYFSCKATKTQSNFYGKKPEKPVLPKQTKNVGMQIQIEDVNVLQCSANLTMSDKKTSLCIFGRKFEDDLTINGYSVGIQVQTQKQFMKNRYQFLAANRKRSKTPGSSRPSSLLQIKENNFLNRGNLHTNPLIARNR